MATDNDYIDQLASSLSESIVDLAKVGYADQFIANGIEAYRGGEEIARKVAGLLPGVRENRREFTAYFDDPSGQIVDPIFRRFDYETQRSLSRLARDYFHAVDRFEEWAQEGILLGQMIQERGAVLALVAELQRLLHRPNKTGKTLLKLHEKRKLELFVDMGRGPKWHLLGDWESQRDAAATTAAAGGSEELADWERELLGDPVDPRREVAETIAKVSTHHPGRKAWMVDDVNDLVASPKPSEYAFEEVISWLRTYVGPGYPVIFKSEAERYITEHMVAYLQRPEGEAGIYDLREEMLGNGSSILTHAGEDEAVKVMVNEGSECIALSFDCYKRNSDGTWNLRAGARREEQAFEQFMDDVRASKDPVFYFVAGSDNKTRRSLVEGRELLATSLTPADILYCARNRGVTMPAMVVEKALPGRRGLLVRTSFIK